MPQLEEKKLEPKKILLPSTIDKPEDEQAWAVVQLGPTTAGDIVNMGEEANSVAMGFHLLVSRMIEWNMTNDKGEVEPINTETVGRLKMEDLTALMKEMGEGAKAVAAELPKVVPEAS